MYQPEAYGVALAFMITSMICWGSWANTMKLTAGYAFQLFYWDYVIGILLGSVLWGFTLGSAGDGSLAFVNNLQQADALHLLGLALLIQKRPREAVVPLAEAARAAANPLLETHYALALRDVGRRDEAIDWLEKNKFKLFAARVDGVRDYTDADYRGRAAIALGSLRVRPSGSDGGHRGLRSIHEALGTADFARIRIGIRTAPVAGGDLAQEVLAPFSSEEREIVSRLVEQAADCIDLILEKGVVAAMNRFNRRQPRDPDGPGRGPVR